jgi:CubicO group peptidase (beta-lactamase class C family)
MRTATIAIVLSLSPSTQSLAQNIADGRIQRIMTGLRPAIAVIGQPAVRWSLEERMAALHVPGVSIAIIDSGRIVYVGAFGVRDAMSRTPVTTSTLFQAQSISKAITATAMLALVDAGRLSLDTDVNTWLRTWKVPRNRFTDSVPVTLRRIASHSAGIVPASFPGYAPQEPIPSLVQILNGERPANTPAIRVDTFPGSREQYSGGGVLVEQQLLMDVTHESFPVLMKRLVLDRAGMRSSTFAQPLSDIRATNAASAHDLNGVVFDGKWRVFPEIAPAGLWSTATDLANWAINISDAWNGATGRILSPATARLMLTRQLASAGLGVFLEGQGASFAFGHSGSTRGYRAEVLMLPGTRQGVAIMTNADQGSTIIAELVRSIGAEYNWTGRAQKQRATVSLDPKELEGLVGTYDAPPLPDKTPALINITQEGGRLFFEFAPFNPKLELYPESRNAFFTLSGIGAVFIRDASDRALSVVLAGQVTGRRKP